MNKVDQSMEWRLLFSYDSIGTLRWSGVSYRADTGKVAGSKRRANGRPTCIAVCYKGLNYYAHRIIWEMHYGPIPQGMVIDHINGDPWDNRIENLRCCTQVENMRNRKKTVVCKSGLKGVSRHQCAWVASIGVNKRKIHLGSFRTKGLAAVAYAKASIRYHGQYSTFTKQAQAR